MKRSEIILNISSNLWGKNIPTNSKELAELVITLAEENGMLPPPKELISYSRFEGRVGSILKAEYYENGMWEDESPTKERGTSDFS